MSEPTHQAPADPSARRLAVLIGSLHEAVLLEDETRHMQLVNQAFCTMFGIDAVPEALIGMDCSQAAEQSKLLFLDPERFVADVNALLAARETRIGDVLRMTDGRVVERDYIPIFFDESPSPVGGAAATYRGHLWKYRDITARARERAKSDTLRAVSEGLVDADTDARVSARVLHALMGLGWQAGTVFLPAPQPAWMTGPRTSPRQGLAAVACVADSMTGDAVDTYRNLTAATMFEHDDGLVGRTWMTGRSSWVDDVLTFSGCARVSQTRAAHLGTVVFVPIRAGKTVHGVLEVAAAHERPLDADVLQALQEAGERLGQVVEQIRARDLQAVQEAWTQTILDRMVEGLIVVSGPTGEIVGVNMMAERMFGYAAGTMKGRHMADLIPPGPIRDDPGFPNNAYEASINRTTEWEVQRADGTVFPIELQLTAFDTGTGQVLVGFMTDLTERNSVDRLKKQFVATVSHELRTPLTSVRGSLGLLATGALGELSPAALEMVNLAERNVVRLVGLINDILDLERLETQGLRMELAPTSLHTALLRAADAIRSFADEHGISIGTHATDLIVVADAQRLVQVLVNLLSNAVKFSTMGAQVDVRAAVVDGCARIEVNDRGPGVPEEFRDAMFEPFRQAEGSDARRRGGSGLGLAISRAIVRQQDGHIGYEPRTGGGSTFWFTVPLARNPRA